MMTRNHFTFFSFLFVALLAGCGAGGGGAFNSIPASVHNGGASGTSASLLLPKTFDVVDLGANVYPNAINNKNAIVGSFTDASGFQEAFLYQNGGLQKLPAISNYQLSSANDINDSGTIVGYSTQTPTSYLSEATLFHPSAAATDLGELTGVPGSSANAISNSGIIVGYSGSNDVGYCYRAVQFDGKRGVTQIRGYNADAVNNAGTVAGETFATATGSCYIGETLPILDNPNITIPLPTDYSPSVGGSPSDINDAGVVVGTYLYPGNCDEIHVGCYAAGFTYENGTTTAMHAPQNSMGQNLKAFALDNTGWIVGAFGGIGYQYGSTEHAFLNANGTFVDLNTRIPATCGFTLYEAHDVNDSGAIVGIGAVGGREHGFLLLPHQTK